ncbi:MAG: DNA topoisomerase IV subunit A, partial [Rickettsia endosymbiont of Ixodes ricinus]|nr:DNA topoisomerase IV subunit A [Rickettsia endosymbiont of Ixodes ricinus]
IGESPKLLIFNVDAITEMKKGQGGTLQRFKNAKLLDIKIFNKEDGLGWNNNGKVKLEKNIIAFLGKRGSTGKLPPMGFPKNSFT